MFLFITKITNTSFFLHLRRALTDINLINGASGHYLDRNLAHPVAEKFKVHSGAFGFTTLAVLMLAALYWETWRPGVGKKSDQKDGGPEWGIWGPNTNMLYQPKPGKHLTRIYNISRSFVVDQNENLHIFSDPVEACSRQVQGWWSGTWHQQKNRNAHAWIGPWFLRCRVWGCEPCRNMCGIPMLGMVIEEIQPETQNSLSSNRG